MPFRPDRIIDSFKFNTNKKMPNEMITQLSDYEKLTNYNKKVELIINVVKNLHELTGKKTTRNIFTRCGSHCIGSTIIEKAKKLYIHSNGIKEYIENLNRNHIGGGRLSYRNGMIKGGYDKCYCGSVSRAKVIMPIDYCYCSAGWYKKLFEETLCVKADVKILNSIISGSKTCDFEIRINEKINIK